MMQATAGHSQLPCHSSHWLTTGVTRQLTVATCNLLSVNVNRDKATDCVQLQPVVSQCERDKATDCVQLQPVVSQCEPWQGNWLCPPATCCQSMWTVTRQLTVSSCNLLSVNVNRDKATDCGHLQPVVSQCEPWQGNWLWPPATCCQSMWTVTRQLTVSSCNLLSVNVNRDKATDCVQLQPVVSQCEPWQGNWLWPPATCCQSMWTVTRQLTVSSLQPVVSQCEPVTRQLTVSTCNLLSVNVNCDKATDCVHLQPVVSQCEPWQGNWLCPPATCCQSMWTVTRQLTVSTCNLLSVNVNRDKATDCVHLQPVVSQCEPWQGNWLCPPATCCQSMWTVTRQLTVSTCNLLSVNVNRDKATDCVHLQPVVSQCEPWQGNWLCPPATCCQSMWTVTRQLTVSTCNLLSVNVNRDKATDCVHLQPVVSQCEPWQGNWLCPPATCCQSMWTVTRQLTVSTCNLLSVNVNRDKATDCVHLQPVVSQCEPWQGNWLWPPATCCQSMWTVTRQLTVSSCNLLSVNVNRDKATDCGHLQPVVSQCEPWQGNWLCPPATCCQSMWTVTRQLTVATCNLLSVNVNRDKATDCGHLQPVVSQCEPWQGNWLCPPATCCQSMWTVTRQLTVATCNLLSVNVNRDKATDCVQLQPVVSQCEPWQGNWLCPPATCCQSMWTVTRQLTVATCNLLSVNVNRDKATDCVQLQPVVSQCEPWQGNWLWPPATCCQSMWTVTKQLTVSTCNLLSVNVNRDKATDCGHLQPVVSQCEPWQGNWLCPPATCCQSMWTVTRQLTVSSCNLLSVNVNRDKATDCVHLQPVVSQCEPWQGNWLCPPATCCQSMWTVTRQLTVATCNLLSVNVNRDKATDCVSVALSRFTLTDNRLQVATVSCLVTVHIDWQQVAGGHSHIDWQQVAGGHSQLPCHGSHWLTTGCRWPQSVALSRFTLTDNRLQVATVSCLVTVHIDWQQVAGGHSQLPCHGSHWLTTGCRWPQSVALSRFTLTDNRLQVDTPVD